MKLMTMETTNERHGGCVYCDGKLFRIDVYFILMNEIIVNRSAKTW